MIGFIEQLKTKIRLIVGRALINAVYSADGNNGLSVDITLAGGESHSKVPMVQHYGIVSKPNKSSEAVVLFIGGARDNGIVISSQGDTSKIPNIQNGEVALFSEYGQTILLKNDGSIVATPKSGKAYRIESDVEVTGDLKVLCDGAKFVTMQNHQHPTPTGTATAPMPGF